MTWLALTFEAVVAALLVAMLIYAVKLNTRLTALRERDAEIRDMIGQFSAAADQANASVANLKAAGLEAEQSLRVAIARAQTLRDDLDRVTDGGIRHQPAIPNQPRPAAVSPPAPAPARDRAGFPTVAEILSSRRTSEEDADADPGTRSGNR